MKYHVGEIVGSVVAILKREWEYIKPNQNPGHYVNTGNTVTAEEIKNFGGQVVEDDGNQQVRAYDRGPVKFDATFTKAPGGNPYWYITNCGQKVNGDPRESIRGFELKPETQGLENLVK